MTDGEQTAAADARFRRLIENSAVATTLISPDGHFRIVNRAMCEMVGYDAAALLSMTWRDVTAPEDLPNSRAAVADLLSGRKDSFRLTKRYLHRDGHLVWGDLTLSCMRDADGAVELLIAQIVDHQTVHPRRRPSGLGGPVGQLYPPARRRDGVVRRPVHRRHRRGGTAGPASRLGRPVPAADGGLQRRHGAHRPGRPPRGGQPGAVRTVRLRRGHVDLEDLAGTRAAGTARGGSAQCAGPASPSGTGCTS